MTMIIILIPIILTINIASIIFLAKLPKKQRWIFCEDRPPGEVRLGSTASRRVSHLQSRAFIQRTCDLSDL